VKRAAAANRGSDFFSIRNYLPRETRTYVPRLLAVRALVAEPEKYDLTLPTLANEPHFEVIETGGQIDMALAAELAGLETDRLYQLNAGVNRWATDPDGPHRLVVPIAHAHPLAAAIAELGERERVRWTRYRIARGDTLGQLAQKFATTPAVLREINQIRGNTIRAGDYLMIPHAHEPAATYAQSVDARVERRQSRTQEGVRRVHVVRRGESLWSIARRYDVAIRSLASWNSMAPGDTLSVGRELVVWTDDTAVATVAAQTGGTSGIAALAQDPVRRVNYIVRKGDSLSSIARRFRVTVGNLMQWNNGVSAQRYLQPGERLVMFVNVTEQST
jgi:membrane-bound lytic murein transglycosylase D